MITVAIGTRPEAVEMASVVRVLQARQIPVALADAIAGLAGDPEACLRMAAVNRLRSEEFDWDRLAVKVREQYLLAIAAHRRRRSRAPRERAAEGS